MKEEGGNDWFQELSYFAAERGGRVLKKKNADGRYTYVAIDEFKNILITIESERDLRFVKHKPRGRKHR